MTHTPTPWKTTAPTSYRVSTADENLWFAQQWNDTRKSEELTANSKRIVACVNFFHGRDIPTENIAEGGFWELVQFVEFARDTADGKMLYEEAQALLTKLGVEP